MLLPFCPRLIYPSFPLFPVICDSTIYPLSSFVKLSPVFRGFSPHLSPMFSLYFVLSTTQQKITFAAFFIKLLVMMEQELLLLPCPGITPRPPDSRRRPPASVVRSVFISENAAGTKWPPVF